MACSATIAYCLKGQLTPPNTKNEINLNFMSFQTHMVLFLSVKDKGDVYNIFSLNNQMQPAKFEYADVRLSLIFLVFYSPKKFLFRTLA